MAPGVFCVFFCGGGGGLRASETRDKKMLCNLEIKLFQFVENLVRNSGHDNLSGY